MANDKCEEKKKKREERKEILDTILIVFLAILITAIVGFCKSDNNIETEEIQDSVTVEQQTDE